MRNIEVNPQEVMILTEEALRAGWIRGSEHGFGTIDFDGRKDHDAQGVCVVGALRQSLTTVLRPQIELALKEIPEYVALPFGKRDMYCRSLVSRHVQALLNIFRTRVEKVLGGHIEQRNDTGTRRKQEVLEAMRASLEIITQECVEAWEREGSSVAASEVPLSVVVAGKDK